MLRGVGAESTVASPHIIVETMEKMGIKLLQATLDIADIRKKYHTALDGRKIARAQPRLPIMR
ncbi:MAG: hypothetical protein V7609_1330 [Verrucomicrobiota bacterium]